MNVLILLGAIAAGPAIDPVVVTATRIETPVRDVLASVELIRGEDLMRQPATDLGDALRMVPGVEVVRLGGPGQQTSLFIRGTESNHVLVLMDGLRINPSIGNAAIQNIAPELVERVEIVKGPRSTLYGSEALGGVINVITRRGAEDGSSVQAGFGRYDTRSASFNAGIGGQRGDASFGGSWIESGGFPAGSGETIDRGYENLSFTAAGRAELSSVELGLRAWHAAGTTEYSQFGTPLDQDFKNSALALTTKLAPSESWDTRLMAGYALDDIDQNQLSDFDQNGVKDFAQTRRWSLDWQNDLMLSERNTLTAGILWQDEDVDAESFDLPYGADTTTSQFYLQDQATLGRHHLLLAAAYMDHEILRRARDLERRIRHRFGGRRAPDGGGRHRFPRARYDGSLRIRRKSRSRSRRVPQLRAQLPAADRRASVVDAVGLSQRDRRFDRLRRAQPRHFRRREPKRRTGAHRWGRGGMEVRWRVVGCACHGDTPGSARSDDG